MGYRWPDLPANSGLGWDSLSSEELVLYGPRHFSEVASWRRTLADIRSRPEVKR